MSEKSVAGLLSSKQNRVVGQHGQRDGIDQLQGVTRFRERCRLGKSLGRRRTLGVPGPKGTNTFATCGKTSNSALIVADDGKGAIQLPQAFIVAIQGSRRRRPSPQRSRTAQTECREAIATAEAVRRATDRRSAVRQADCADNQVLLLGDRQTTEASGSGARTARHRQIRRPGQVRMHFVAR